MSLSAAQAAIVLAKTPWPKWVPPPTKVTVTQQDNGGWHVTLDRVLQPVLGHGLDECPEVALRKATFVWLATFTQRTRTTISPGAMGVALKAAREEIVRLTTS